MNVESRKIQEVTGGTYTVSLPERWAVDADLSAGSVVNLHVHGDGNLVVRSASGCNEPFERVTVECQGDAPRRVERALRAAYAAGANRVILEATAGFSTADRRAVESVTRTLTGLTVGRSDDERISVRALLDTDQVSLEQSVRQLQFVALSKHRDATAALAGTTAADEPDANEELDSNHEPDVRGSSGAHDEQAGRLFALVDRHFERALVRLDEVAALEVGRSELFALWTTARELERVADHAKRLAAVANARDGGLSDDHERVVADLAAAARGVVDDAVEFAVHGADVTTAWDALDRRERVLKDVATLEQDVLRDDDVDADYRLVRVLDTITRTAECGGAIAERGVRHAVRDGRLAERDAGVDADADRSTDADADRSTDAD